MKLSMSTMCFDQASLHDKILAICEAGFDGIELWVKDFDKNSIKLYSKILKDYGVKVIQTAKLDGWFELDGSLMGVSDDFSSILDECKKRIDISKELDAEYIVAFPSRDDRGKFAPLEEGIARFIAIKEYGEKVGVIPTLEFIGQTSQINTINAGFDFIQKTNSKLIVDCFHLWRRGTIDDFKLCDIRSDQISLLHVSDASEKYIKEEYKDRHRVMPGDGVIDIQKFFDIAKSKGYNEFVSLGAYNKDEIVDPYGIARIGYSKLKAFLND